MRPRSSGVRRFLLVALIAAMLSSPALAGDPYGILSPPPVHVLLIIDRQANLSGAGVTERNIRRLTDAMKSSGLCGDPTVLDTGVSPTSIVEQLGAMDLRGRSALLVYYLGHGGTDPIYGHVLGTSGGFLWRSALIEAAQKTGPRLVVLLTDACSNAFSAMPTAVASPVSGFTPLPTAVPVGQDTARILASLLLGHEGLVDVNGSSWRRETASGEFGWNSEADGALFTSALTRTLMESRFDQLDANRDGVVSWSEVQEPVTNLNRFLFDSYKEGYLSGRFAMDSVNLERLKGQAAQTPQFSFVGRATRAVPDGSSPPDVRLAWDNLLRPAPELPGVPPSVPANNPFAPRNDETFSEHTDPQAPPLNLFAILGQQQPAPVVQAPSVPRPFGLTDVPPPSPPADPAGDDPPPFAPVVQAPSVPRPFGLTDVPPPSPPAGLFGGGTIPPSAPSPFAEAMQDVLSSPPPLPLARILAFDTDVPPVTAAITPAPAASPARPVRLGVTLADHAGYVLVSAVMDGTPARRIGMQAGDFILAVNDVPVRSAQEFLQAIDAVPRWGRVRLTGRTGPGGQVPVVYEADLDR